MQQTVQAADPAVQIAPGATPQEWGTVMGSDLLMSLAVPIVSNPEIPRDPLSRLPDESLGKVPSVKTSRGTVTGLPGWQTKSLSFLDLSKYAGDPDYGFGLRTGIQGVIAADCDTDDLEMSVTVMRLLCDSLGLDPKDLPLRTRGGHHWACLLHVQDLTGRPKKANSDFGGGNKLEWLGYGQQLACCGRHPSGSRYRWTLGPGGIDIHGPRLIETDCAALARLRDALAPWEVKSSGGGEATPRQIAESYQAPDGLADWLRSSGRVLAVNRDGGLCITCPWEDLHTTHGAPGETVYFPAGVNGYSSGGFRCLHAHCDHRTADDLRVWARTEGWEGEVPVTAYPTEEPSGTVAGNKAPITPVLTAKNAGNAQKSAIKPQNNADNPEIDSGAIAGDGAGGRGRQAPGAGDGTAQGQGAAQPGEPDGPTAAQQLMAWLDQKTGLFKTCATTLQLVLSDPVLCGMDIAYDTFRGQIVLREHNSPANNCPLGGWRQFCDAENFALRVRLENPILRFKPGSISKDLLYDAVNHRAAQNHVDIMQDYLAAVLPEWDGVRRAERFFIDYGGAENSEVTRAAGRYLWGMLYRRASSPEPCKADISIIMTGPQGCHKSQSVRALALEEDFAAELDFRQDNKELALLMSGRTVIEVPEMQGFSRRENSDLKAFLSLDRDSYRVMYSQDIRTVTRRCLFVMTTNERQILRDATGSRRFAVIEVTRMKDDLIQRDRLQLWAEGRQIFLEEGAQRLHTRLENATTKAEQNICYANQDSWADDVAEFVAGQESKPEGSRYPLSTRAILQYALNIDRGQSRLQDQQRVAEIMRTLGFQLEKGSPHRVSGFPGTHRVWQRVTLPPVKPEKDGK